MVRGFRGVEAQPKCTEQGQAAEEVDSLHVCYRALALKIFERGLLAAQEWLQTLLADINNQQVAADRLINPDCIFKWAQALLKGLPALCQEHCDVAHEVFYDEERADEPLGFRA